MSHLSWTDSIKPSLLFWNFGCCISKGSPFRLFDSEVLITTGKALITFCVDFFLIKCFDRQLYFSAKMISLGFYFSHAKTLFYIFDINKSIFQQIIINSMKTVCNVSRVTTKPTIWHVRPAKTTISLGIRSIWSESSLSPWRNIKSLATHWAHSEDSDPSLRWAHTGHFVGFVTLRLMCQKG